MGQGEPRAPCAMASMSATNFHPLPHRHRGPQRGFAQSPLPSSAWLRNADAVELTAKPAPLIASVSVLRASQIRTGRPAERASSHGGREKRTHHGADGQKRPGEKSIISETTLQLNRWTDRLDSAPCPCSAAGPTPASRAVLPASRAARTTPVLRGSPPLRSGGPAPAQGLIRGTGGRSTGSTGGLAK
jgi:hypothetical protein